MAEQRYEGDAQVQSTADANARQNGDENRAVDPEQKDREAGEE
jgi:hypothetical protein